MEVVPDAYEEHVRQLRERAARPKTATLAIPLEEMQAIFLALSDALKATTTLTPEHRRRWDSIMRSIGRAIVEAE